MFKLDKYAIRTVSGALLAALMFTTSAAAWTGNSGVTYNSKNKIQTDDGQIVIDAADITTLDNALAANNTTRNNFDTTAASLYTNLTGISSGVTSAKSALATNLYNMKIRITKDSNGNVVAKASDSPLNWNNTTASVTSTGVNTFTMKQYIDAMTKSVTATDSERTATATYALPSEEKTLADSKSAWSFTLDESNTSATGLNMAGVSNLYLGKGESITLPSGYYGNNLTISNGVKSGGSFIQSGKIWYCYYGSAGYMDLSSLKSWQQGWYFVYVGLTADISHIYMRYEDSKGGSQSITFFNDDGTMKKASISVPYNSVVAASVDKSYKYWTISSGGALAMYYKVD